MWRLVFSPMQADAVARARRSTLISGVVLVAMTVVCVFVVDAAAARLVRSIWPSRPSAVTTFIFGLERVFLFRYSIYARGGAVLFLAGVFRLTGSRAAAKALAFVAISQLATRALVDILKPVFSRLRPFEAFTGEVLTDRFFAAVGNAFPSGHAAHFWGLYFALAVLLPNWRLALLVLPVLASAARVIVNDHYVGDVMASAAVAALVTVACTFVLWSSQALVES